VSVIGVEHPLAPVGQWWKRVGVVHEGEILCKVIDLGGVRDFVENRFVMGRHRGGVKGPAIED
jgi:ABC-type uncharacterized transport system ATPase subunit